MPVQLNNEIHARMLPDRLKLFIVSYVTIHVIVLMQEKPRFIARHKLRRD